MAQISLHPPVATLELWGCTPFYVVLRHFISSVSLQPLASFVRSFFRCSVSDPCSYVNRDSATLTRCGGPEKACSWTRERGRGKRRVVGGLYGHVTSIYLLKNTHFSLQPPPETHPITAKVRSIVTMQPSWESRGRAWAENKFAKNKTERKQKQNRKLESQRVAKQASWRYYK